MSAKKKNSVDVDIAEIKGDVKYLREGFEEFKKSNRSELTDFKTEVRTNYITRDQMKSAAAVLLITFFVNIIGAYLIAKLINTNEQPASIMSERSAVEVVNDRQV